MLYHLKPVDFVGETIYPLSSLKKFAPDLYQSQLSKYQGRDHVPNNQISVLGCTWADVVFLTAVHPHALTEVLKKVGFQPMLRFVAFEINPAILETKRISVYDFNHQDLKWEGEYTSFDCAKLPDYAYLREETTLAHYREMFKIGKPPFLFAGVSHVLHRGELSINGLPIVTG